MAKSAAALVVAAGRGTRLADPVSALPKQYRDLAGRPVLTHTLNALGNHPRICRIVTVIHPDDLAVYDDAAGKVTADCAAKLAPAVSGGATRQQSVLSGLLALRDSGCDDVLIHDAARPFVSLHVLDALFEALDRGTEGALSAVPVTDTLKRADSAGVSTGTVERAGLFAAQTPQAFGLGRILAAHEAALAAGRTDFTDDTGLAEWHGLKVTICAGDAANFKITTPADLSRAEHEARQRPMPDTDATPAKLSDLPDVRTGIGYDVHAFEDGVSVVLGGLEIAHERALKGHSDADVVLHAITDATLGAIGDGDIGQHFPPSDPQWKGASSDRFQRHALALVEALGGRIAHIDVTVVCEAPKIGPHREAMRRSVAEICRLSANRVSVKATTSEKLGFTGRGEGIAALASVTVRLPFKDDE